MSEAATEATICNSALTRVGAAKISSLNDATTEGLLCKQHYYSVLYAFLRSHPWKFAKARASLAADPVAPTWGYATSFQLPPDCLRVLNMDGEEQFPWTVEGRSLMSDQATANIVYITNSKAPGEYDATFCEALSSMLAHLFAYPLTQNLALRDDISKEMKLKIAEARSFNGQEGSGDRVYANTWLNSRA